jgi:hypothetical protein
VVCKNDTHAVSHFPTRARTPMFFGAVWNRELQ